MKIKDIMKIVKISNKTAIKYRKDKKKKIVDIMNKNARPLLKKEDVKEHLAINDYDVKILQEEKILVPINLGSRIVRYNYYEIMNLKRPRPKRKIKKVLASKKK